MAIIQGMCHVKWNYDSTTFEKEQQTTTTNGLWAHLKTEMYEHDTIMMMRQQQQRRRVLIIISTGDNGGRTAQILNVGGHVPNAIFHIFGNCSLSKVALISRTTVGTFCHTCGIDKFQ